MPNLIKVSILLGTVFLFMHVHLVTNANPLLVDLDAVELGIFLSSTWNTVEEQAEYVRDTIRDAKKMGVSELFIFAETLFERTVDSLDTLGIRGTECVTIDASNGELLEAGAGALKGTDCDIRVSMPYDSTAFLSGFLKGVATWWAVSSM